MLAFIKFAQMFQIFNFCRTNKTSASFSFMFWTVWDANDAKVERATLAGENRTILWSLGKEDSGWPNGLTIDYLEERVYWVAAKYVVVLHNILSPVYVKKHYLA